SLLDLLAKLAVGGDHLRSDILGRSRHRVGPQHQPRPVLRLKVGDHPEVEVDQLPQLVDRRMRSALLDDSVAELTGDRFDEALHQRTLGPEVMRREAAAVSRALADVGERHPGRSYLAYKLGGGVHQSALGLDPALFLRARNTGVSHRWFRPAPAA